MTKKSEETKNLEAVSSKIRGFLKGLLDEDSLVETGAFASGKTILGGVDAPGEGVVTGYGTIGGCPVYFFADNGEVFGGSMSQAHAAKIQNVMEMAIRNGVPFISVIDSAGVRIGEGLKALDAYSRLTAMAYELKSNVPHIAYIKGNAFGMTGVYASYADFVICSEKSVMSLNAPSVVCAKEGISSDFNKAFAARKSTLPAFKVKSDAEVRDLIIDILAVTGTENVDTEDDPNRTDALNGADAKTLVASLADDNKVVEYASDFAKEVYCAFASVNGIRVGIVASDKKENELLTMAGVSKITDFVNLLSSFDLPLIELIDYKGFKTCLECENKGASEKVGRLTEALLDFTGARLAVVTGNCVGAIYSVLVSKELGNGYTLAFDDAFIAPINPETAVPFYVEDLKKAKDPIKAREQIQALYASENSALAAAKEGVVDAVIDPDQIRPYVSSALLMLLGL